MEGFSEPLADHGSWEFEPATGRMRWSPSLYRIHGVSTGEFEPTIESIRPLIPDEDWENYVALVRQATAQGTPFTCQHRVTRPSGEQRTILVRGGFVPGRDGEPDRLIGVTQDVTGREGEEELLWHLANHDSLTGLFNRRRFMEELARELAYSQRRGEEGAVLMLDLDHFKDINDSLGHLAGDTLLTRVAGQLRERLRSTDILARLGGDEFAVVLPACPEPEAARVATELLAAMRDHVTVRIAGLDRPVTGSAGIARFGPGQLRTADELLIEADLAMYKAKAEGRGGLAVFDEGMRAELAARLSLETELREALAHGRMIVQYQPIVAMGDGTTVGCEALVRWDHPTRGVVAPGAFIDVAEQCGLIGEIGRFVLAQACAQAAEWRRGGNNLFVSVNVSPLQLVAEDMPGQVRAALAASGLPAPLLCLEITETSLLNQSAAIVASLRELKELGVRIAIDDFGGGASSLGLMRLMPIDQIKVDRLFVEGIAERADDRAIVAAVLSLADELGLTVVAEGIETARQQGQLRELGCQFGQGFLYSQPRDARDLELGGYSAVVQPGVGDPSVIREFMRQVGIPARVGEA